MSWNFFSVGGMFFNEFWWWRFVALEGLFYGDIGALVLLAMWSMEGKLPLSFIKAVDLNYEVEIKVDLAVDINPLVKVWERKGVFAYLVFWMLSKCPSKYFNSFACLILIICSQYGLMREIKMSSPKL